MQEESKPAQQIMVSFENSELKLKFLNSNSIVQSQQNDMNSKSLIVISEQLLKLKEQRQMDALRIQLVEEKCQKIEELQKRIEETTRLMGKTNNLFSEIQENGQDFNNKILTLESKLNEKIKDQIAKNNTQKLGFLKQNYEKIKQTTVDIEKVRKSLSKDIEEDREMYMFSDERKLFQQMIKTQQIEDSSIKEYQNSIWADHFDDFKSVTNKKFKNFSQQIVHISDKVKRLFHEFHEVEKYKSLFKWLHCLDMQSPYENKFKINGQNIEMIGENIITQLFKEKIIKRGIMSQFNVQVIKTETRQIFIGVLDITKQKNMRRSCDSGNAVGYWGWNGVIHYGNSSGKWQQLKNQGIGFFQGQLVTMQINLSVGNIKWIVDGQIRAEINSPILSDPTRIFMPYVEMCCKGDMIEWY